MELKEHNSNEVVKALTEEKKPPTRAEYKKMMGMYFTQRRDRVEYCGHKFHPENQPKRNCPWCWFAFFQIHGEVTQTADECFQKDGREMLVRVKGEKFTKNFLRFMETLAYMKENKINGFDREVDREMESRRSGQ